MEVTMKLSREELREYASHSDTVLWTEMRAIAARYGYSLPEKTPPHSDMERVRNIMLGNERISMSEGMKMLRDYKAKAGGGEK